MSLFVFWLLYMRSTFLGTELDFLLKLTRQPKNNPLLQRKRKMGEMGEGEGRENGVMKEKGKGKGRGRLMAAWKK